MINIEQVRKLYKLGKNLSLTDIQDLFSNAKTRTFKKRAILINADSTDNSVYFIRKGLVRMYHIKETGEEITFQLFAENRFVVNIDKFMENSSSRYFVEALEDTQTLSIDFDKLQEIIAANPKLQSNRIIIFRRLMRENIRRVESFILLNPEERYLQYVQEFPNIVERVPDKYIANVLGITPVSLSRIRKRIAEKNGKK